MGRGCVGLYIKDSLPSKRRSDLVTTGSLAFFISGGGGSSKMAPLQVKHRYQVSDEIGSLPILLIFLLVRFDTLTWPRAGRGHVSDRGELGGGGCGGEAPRKIRDHALQTLGKQGFALTDIFWFRKTFLRRLYTLYSFG